MRVDGETDAFVDDILMHFGVKGMKWGVRRSPERQAARAKKKAARAERKKVRRAARQARNAERWKAFEEIQDKKFEDRANEFDTKVRLHNRAGEKMNRFDLDTLNSKSEYIQAAQSGVLLKDDHPVTQKYHKEYTDIYMKRVNEAANEMSNWTGTRTYKAEKSDDFLGFRVKAVDIDRAAEREAEHAADSTSYQVHLILDRQGFITGSKIVDDVLAQGLLAVGEILKHYGVKGQKWGVRRDRSPQPVTVSTKKRGTKSEVKTKGGANQPVHSDAVAARTIGRQSKKSGLDTLSNKDLEAYARRLDLERRVRQLESQDSHGKNFIQKFFANKKNRQATVKALTDENNINKIKKGNAAIKAARSAKKASKAAAAAA